MDFGSSLVVQHGFGTLAPRGWYCFGTYGSNGSTLYVSPEPIKAAVFSTKWNGFAGTAIQLSTESGDTSGRFGVAKTIARVFPAHLQFVKHVIAEGIMPESSFPSGPYARDKLTYRSNEIVEFETPANSEGLGTDSRLQKNNSPISGVALLFGVEPNLLQLSARLSQDTTGLVQAIIQQAERDAASNGTNNDQSGGDPPSSQPQPSFTEQTSTSSSVANTSTAEPEWPEKTGAYVATSSEDIPQFPSNLSGFRYEEGKDFWSRQFSEKGTLRVFYGNGWEGIYQFPDTMNGCSAGMYMIRWRSANRNVKLESSSRYSRQSSSRSSSESASGTPKIGAFGYMFGSNCEEPMFRFVDASDGATLVDVYYELKFWQAAP